MKIYGLVMALLMAIALTACSHNRNEKDEHAHDEKLQLASYNNDFEVFAEAVPFVTGKSSEILAYFSFLNNFKPLEKGSVTISLIVGTDGIKQTQEHPLRPGIYIFALKPETAGTGKLIFDINTSEGNSQIIVPNIKVYKDEHDAQHSAADAAISSSNGVVFTKEQSWKIDFATEEARQEPFGQIIKTSAQIQPSQGDERVISAKAAGMVHFSKDNIVDGKEVNAGQALFSIESSGLADNNLDVRASEAATEYNRAKTEYDRKKELAKDRIVSESDLLKAQTELTNAETVYNSLRRNFSGGRQVVSSPINGFVKQLLVRNGEYAEAGQTIMVVTQNQDLLVKAELQPKYYPLLSNITSANIRIMNSNIVYSLDDLNGRVVSYGKSSDLTNPLIPVVFQVKNNIGLLPGSFVEMYIKTLTNSQAITIPNEAIVEEMGNYFAFVQLTPEFFEKRAIRKGVTDGLRTEILEGISAGERVVTKGAILVKLAQASGALDAHSGHAH